MGKEIVKIKFENIKDLLLNPDKYNKDVIYVIALKNCNGITTELLNSIDSLYSDIKFKIDDDLFNYHYQNDKNDAILEYNYNIEQMKEIIAYFEEVVNFMPKMNDFGKFLFIYTLLCGTSDYDKSFGFDFENYFKLESIKRSVYGVLINGEGVCAGDSLTLYLLLSYVNIDCKKLYGTAYLSNGNSGEHAWNAVLIDGKWYYVDVTFDRNDMINFKNCLVVNDDFMSSHKLNEKSQIRMQNCKMAQEDYDHELILQSIYYLSKDYILKNDLTKKLKSHRISKKGLKNSSNYIDDISTGTWGDLLSSFGFNLNNDGDKKKK